jgi:post-segregation antitoxin (ccd killing protein)
VDVESVSVESESVEAGRTVKDEIAEVAGAVKLNVSAAEQMFARSAEAVRMRIGVSIAS